MRKVLLMIHRLLRGGGTETHVRLLATRLAREGWQVGVFTAGGPWVPFLRRHGIRIHIDDRDDNQRLLALRQLVKRENYAVVHAHDSSSGRMAAKLQGTGAKVVLTLHGTYMLDEHTKRAARKAAAVIVVSPELQTLARRAGVSEECLHLIPNGVSTDIFHPGRASGLRKLRNIDLDAFVIGYAGRFTLSKGELGKRIVRALYGYVDKHPQVYLAVAGRGAESVVKTRHKRIIICGHMDEMPEFYRACDVVIGTGRVALEAAACAVPTIAVGEMMYMGRLQKDKLEQAASTNFGDHGQHARLWSNAGLLKDVEQTRMQSEQSKKDALEVLTSVRARYSAGEMSKAVQQVYGL